MMAGFAPALSETSCSLFFLRCRDTLVPRILLLRDQRRSYLHRLNLGKNRTIEPNVRSRQSRSGLLNLELSMSRSGCPRVRLSKSNSR